MSQLYDDKYEKADVNSFKVLFYAVCGIASVTAGIALDMQHLYVFVFASLRQAAAYRLGFPHVVAVTARSVFGAGHTTRGYDAGLEGFQRG
ncbi:hypothetical protein CYMTET_9797 [Cymbomonas tetramitiformis]|uniref:Uncharacterized protein n=1 Tax=Cymbomonas tetramitiformis TaxID=36881 RepID=A0AAE0GQJ9_9CHLO|nr:hypothetical protein CYMTET_9797 [Cymbomonas tetramitiformis]